MAGTVPVAGNLSLEDLAATLTSHEQLAFEQVTGLTVDPNRPRNLVTTVAQAHQLGPLALCPSGEPAHGGTRILSTTVYILGKKTAVDVLRLPSPEDEEEEDTAHGPAPHQEHGPGHSPGIHEILASDQGTHPDQPAPDPETDVTETEAVDPDPVPSGTEADPSPS